MKGFRLYRERDNLYYFCVREDVRDVLVRHGFKEVKRKPVGANVLGSFAQQENWYGRKEDLRCETN